MATQEDQLHFILFPLMAQGHMIPMVDIARLLAQRGVVVTIVTTALNTLRFKTLVDRAIESNLPVRLLELQFPTAEVGLPEGCENVDALPSRDLAKNFFTATSMLQKPFEQSLGEMELMPSCIISDFCFPWTSESARKIGIPRLIFHGISCFALLCSHNILQSKAHESVTSDSESFVIPGLSDRIEITKSRLPGSINKSASDLKQMAEQMDEAELTAYGVVLNSFYELEPKFLKEYRKVKQNKAWCVGPVSLYNKEALDKIERGKKSSIDENQCLKWLDSRQPNSVIYVCLGSLCRLIPSQLMEIGLGLEASKCSFIWVVRGGDRYKELEKWFSEGFEERTKDRGLVIKGWAPQVLILSHQAIGGFLTHCGWNSTLEGVCAGVQMLTWPMFAEQFFNEKLIVQVLGIGVEVGTNEPVMWGEEEKVGVVVKKEEVEKAVKKLMEESDEREERIRKARELAKMARNAMEEGGSSHLSMTLLIQDIKQSPNKKTFIQERNNVEDKFPLSQT